MQVERSDIVQLRYFTNGVHSPLPYAVWVKRPTEPIKNYDVLSGYAGGEMVFKDNKLYKSNNATPPGWIDVDWDEQLPYIGFVSDFDVKKKYIRDDLVYVPGDTKVYVCIAAPKELVTGTWDAAKWEALQDGTVIVDIVAYPFSGSGKVTGKSKGFKVEETAVDESKVIIPPFAGQLKSYIGYWPSWRCETFGLGDTSTTLRKPSNTPDYFSHIMLSFAHTTFAFDAATPSFAGTGLSFPAGVTPAILKEDIAKVKAKGIKTLLSVGGATYGRPTIADAWTAMLAEEALLTADINNYPAQTPIAKSLVAFLDYMELDGIDLDFEDDPAHHTDMTEYLKVYYRLVVFMGFVKTLATTGKLLANACWSTGWDQTAFTKAAMYTPKSSHNLVSYYGGLAGRERSVFGGFDFNGVNTNAAALVDIFVNMTYDAINSGFMSGSPTPSKYDPVLAYMEARECVTDVTKIMTVGISPIEGFGDHELMLKDADCETSGPHKTILDKDQYQRDLLAPYSVERLIKLMKGKLSTYANDGFILWSLHVATGETYTNKGKLAAGATTASRLISASLNKGTDVTTNIG